MYRSLRKGHTSIYLQHQITGHSIGAELFESEVAGGIATLRLHLRPVDQNQRSDEHYPIEEIDRAGVTAWLAKLRTPGTGIVRR